MSWLPIETAPKDGTELLLWCRYHYGNDYLALGAWRVDDNDTTNTPEWLDFTHDDYSCGYASNRLKPTHWMPLPEPPK